MGGQIMKYLGNMHQGKKIAQTKKVSKAVLKKNEQNINDLMNQVGENEDDSSSENPDNNKISNKKNQPNIDYEMMEDYQPAYSKQKKETEIKDNSVDNNIESLDQSIDIESENKNKPKKQNKIIREKKVVEDDTNNTSGRNLRNRSGIKRMIKQQDESNTNDNRNNILSKSYQKANNPRVIKDITMADNTDNKEKYTTMSFNKNKYKINVRESIQRRYEFQRRRRYRRKAQDSNNIRHFRKISANKNKIKTIRKRYARIKK